MTDLAEGYDAGHGGAARARAAAGALHDLLSGTLLSVPQRWLVLDLAVGTGTVAAQLPGTVVGLDISAPMLRSAACRLPGRVLRADATAALPVRTSCVDAVTAVWWLHTAVDVLGVLREVARVLRPGGVFVTTADKQAADELALGERFDRDWTADTCARLTSAGHQVGLRLCGATSFRGFEYPAEQHHKLAAESVYPMLAFRRSEL